MIYTVTLNPSLDYIVAVEDFRLGITNRTSTELLLPGGKGLNVSMVLKNLGMDSVSLGFAAGFTGEEVMRRLEEMGISNELTMLQDGFTRINFKLKSVDGTEVNGMGPEIPKEKVQALMERLAGLETGDVLFLSGSIPACLPSDIYQRMMEGLQKGVMSVVDVTGEALLKVLPYHPFLIKPNHHELGEIFGVKLTDRTSVIPYAGKLQEIH